MKERDLKCQFTLQGPVTDAAGPGAWNSVWIPTWVAGTQPLELSPAAFQNAHQQKFEFGN